MGVLQMGGECVVTPVAEQEGRVREEPFLRKVWVRNKGGGYPAALRRASPPPGLGLSR